MKIWILSAFNRMVTRLIPIRNWALEFLIEGADGRAGSRKAAEKQREAWREAEQQGLRRGPRAVGVAAVCTLPQGLQGQSVQEPSASRELQSGGGDAHEACQQW